MFEQLVDVFLKWGIWGLALVSFTESSFFPIPPDVLLIPLSLAAPENALWYAFVTTLFSVLGALFGYFLGRRLGRPLLHRFASEKTITKVEDLFHRYGIWAIIIAGFTPIPYKVFTIASGVFRYSKSSLIIGSVIGRGVRFFAEAAAVLILGAYAQTFLDQYLTPLSVLAAAIILIVYIVYRILKTRT